VNIRTVLSLTIVVSAFSACFVEADEICFVAVPYTDPCAVAGVALNGHPPCTNCTDFIIWTDPVNNVFGSSTGYQAFHAVTASCMVQRRRCGQTLPAGTWVCLANGVQTYTAPSLETDPNFPCDAER